MTLEEKQRAWANSGAPLEQAVKAILGASDLPADYRNWLAEELAATEDVIAAAQAIVQEREQESKQDGSRPFSAFVQSGEFAVQAEGPTSQETRDLLRQLLDEVSGDRALAMTERDEASAAIDRLAEHIAQHDPDLAHYIRTRALTDDDETWMSVPLNPDYQTLCAIAAGTWDAVHAAVERTQREASDLRALAEREAVTVGGGDDAP